MTIYKSNSKPDPQKQIAYATYVMASSWFDKAKCVTPFVEKMLRVAYAEQKNDVQCQMEEQCEKYFAKEVAAHLSDDVWKQDAEVSIIPTESGFYEVQIQTYDYVIRILSGCSGISGRGVRDPKFKSEIWSR